jgi:hypothetical protein
LKKALKYLYFALIFQSTYFLSAYAQTPDKLAKEANTLFKSEQYIEATPKYLQLLSLEPRNHFYNYRYGACLLFNSEKKPDALKYLKFAVSDPDIDPEAHYFLARAYHLNYYFDKAIREYRIYKSKVKDKTALKKDVDRQIEMCQNGQKLMSRVSDIIVKERKSSSYEEFFRLYNLRDIGGSIIVTEEFQTKIDKKRGHKPVIHIAENATIIFYSSYGEVDEGQKDIYYRTLNAKGEWGNPVKLPNSVNTQFDEDFPYLDPNGEYLYFSSKGHNSMGGYDVFRVRFDKSKITFGSVDNLDFAISSPDDDLFYVVDKDYKHAYFASARQSEGGKIHVYRVMVNKFNSNTVMYAGNFLSTVNPNAKSANISIREKTTGRIIDNVKTNSSNGALAFSLPRGGSYEFVVQTDLTKTPQTIPFEAPFLEETQLLRLNFLEEAAGLGTNIRIVLDLNYQFHDDERSDILASLFLAKSELQPNDELADVLNAAPAPAASNADVLSELKLEKYHPHELAEIAETDLNRLKENYRRNEEQRHVFLFLASDAIDKAQQAEVRINELIALSETRGLNAIEIKELENLNKQRNDLLGDAKIALNNANKLQENTPVIQAEIARADAILQKMKTIETKADLAKLNDLSPEERVHMSERFNKTTVFDPAQNLEVNSMTTRIREINRGVSEIDALNAEIAEVEKEIERLQEEKENAKKKDKPAIEARIEELEVTKEARELQVKTLMSKQERMLGERDSLSHVVQVYQQAAAINPQTVAANNNQRLINAKLNAEQAKKIDQATQTVLANNVVPTSSNVTSSQSNQEDELDAEITYFEEQRDKFNAAIEKTELDIQNIDNQLSRVGKNDHQTRVELEQQKLRLVQQQIENWNGLSEFTEDEARVDNALMRYETQASVIENNITELNELLVVQNNTQGENTQQNNTQTSVQNNDVSNTQANNTSSNNNANVSSNNTENTNTNIENNPQQVVNETRSNERAKKDIEKVRGQFLEMNRIDNPNNASKEDVLVMQTYADSIEQLMKQNANDEVYLKVLQQEKKRIDIWMDQAEVSISQREALATNNSTNPQVNPSDANSTQVGSNQTRTTSNPTMAQRVVVGEPTPEMQESVDNIAALKTQSEELSRRLENADSRAESNKILKEMAKIDRAIAENQLDLMLAEQENYGEAVQDIQNSALGLNKDPLLRAEMLIMEQRKNDVQEVVDVLASSSRSDRERILVQAVEIRQDFLNQMDITSTQIAVQNEIARVVRETGLSADILTDPNRLDYALLQINDEIDRTKAKLKELEANKSAYKKSELPAIEAEIQELKAYLKSLEDLRSETKRAIEKRGSTQVLIIEVPQLSSSVDAETLKSMNDAELATMVSNPDFVELRNDVVSFSLLRDRLQNLVNQQVLLRNEMKSTVLLIAQTQDEAERAVLQAKLDALSAEYQLVSKAIDATEPELLKMQQKINSNPLYLKNPTLYHTLAMSTQVQETLLQASVNGASNPNQVASSSVSSGITFLSAPKPANNTGEFGLNPVNIPGMIYKVQIGAFNKPVDLARFSEFEPVTTDQVGNNLIRYSAGIFYTKGQAFQALGPIKALGYADAFVVAYCDGVRYSIAEADELLRQGKCSLNQDAQLAFESRTSTKNVTYHQGPNAAPAQPLELADGLLFTVQIGVFNAPIAHERLQNVMPLNCQLTERNQIRYSVGRFDAVEEAVRQRDAVRLLGFSDAFVVAYFNGERITIAEARAIFDAQGSIALHSQRTKVVNPSAAGVPNLQVVEMAADTTPKIELLSNYPLGKRLVSTATYTKVPMNEINLLRDKGYWAYFDAVSGRIVTSLLTDENTTIPAGYKAQAVYRGFAVENENQVSLNNLLGFDQNTTYYQLELTWENEMPRLVAYYLEQNFTELIAQWNPELGSIQFMPLTFAQKEKIRRALINLGEVRFAETILTF